MVGDLAYGPPGGSQPAGLIGLLCSDLVAKVAEAPGNRPLSALVGQVRR